MDDEQFWNLVARAGPRLDVRRIAASLEALAWWEPWDFQRTLHAMTRALDTHDHRFYARSAGSRPCRPLTADHAPPARTTFDDLAMTVVALGRDVWSAVRATPVLLVNLWPTELGRSLTIASTDAVRSSARTQIDTLADTALRWRSDRRP